MKAWVLFVVFIASLALQSQGQSISHEQRVVWDDDLQAAFITDAQLDRVYKENYKGERLPWPSKVKGTHGIVILDKMLISSSGSVINAYDKISGRLLHTLEAEGASYINALCTDGQGKLYAIDFNTRSLYVVDLSHSVSEWGEVEVLTRLDFTPSAIAFDRHTESLVVSSWSRASSVYRYAAETGKLIDIVDMAIDYISALKYAEGGALYVCAWGEQSLSKYDNDMSTNPTVLAEGVERLRDIAFDQKGNLIAINDGLKLEIPSDAHDWGPMQASVFPNPVSINSMISYRQSEAGEVQIRIYDGSGRLVRDYGEQEMPSGTHQFYISREQMPNGLYFIEINSEEAKETLPITLVD